jgi:phosphoesterase RecJ-like protein
MGMKKVIQAIKKYQRFLLSTHVNPEGDALAGTLALRHLLKRLGKKATIVNADRTPANYQFLPDTGKIIHKIRNLDYEVAILLDCPTPDRTGRVREILEKNKPLVNIDHHISNSFFGQINWVEPKSSSVCEMLFHLYQAFGLLDKKAALYIYVGMLTDTGSFRFENTSCQTHACASQLLSFGLNVPKIYSQIYEQNSLEKLKIFARVLSRMRTRFHDQVVWSKVKNQEWRKIATEEIEEIVNLLRSLRNTKVAFLLREIDKQKIKASFRSKNSFDVNRLAANFGGGGHQRASGAVIYTSIARAERMILKAIGKMLK